MDVKEKKNEKTFFMMILILLSLIIIIFLLACNLGFIIHRPRIPTGNVNIFDILFQQNCDKNCDDKGNDCGNSGELNNNVSGNLGNSEEVEVNGDDSGEVVDPPVDKNGVEVFDKNTEYSKDTPLNIFSSTAYYVVDNKIAPLSENSYQFVVRNNNEFSIKYGLEFTQENKYNINMKYRLRLNGVYIVGSDSDWVSYDELNQYNIGLTANNYDVYMLDWKWFESANDTEVGTNINSNYKLELKIMASEY